MRGLDFKKNRICQLAISFSPILKSCSSAAAVQEKTSLWLRQKSCVDIEEKAMNLLILGVITLIRPICMRKFNDHHQLFVINIFRSQNTRNVSIHSVFVVFAFQFNSVATCSTLPDIVSKAMRRIISCVKVSAGSMASQLTDVVRRHN